MLLALSAVANAQQAPQSVRIPREPGIASARQIEVPVPSNAASAPVAAPQVAAALARGADAAAEVVTGVAQQVLFDEPQPGSLWAAAPTWKAGFDGTAVTFVPFLGSDAPRNFPARFAVSGLAVAGRTLPVAPGTPQRRDGVVRMDRGVMVEQYVTSLAGIEQQFVFEQLPMRGELTVTIAVATDQDVTTAAGAHSFANPFGSFSYGAAVAIDGCGRSVAVASDYLDGALHLTVPAWFVAEAALPLVIDPLIGNVVAVGSSAVHNGAIDLAYDASRDEYLVCFERLFSALDSDVLGVRCNSAMQPLAPQFLIDNTTTSWRGCRVAGLDLYDKFFVVCECEQSGQPTYVAGRTFDAAAVALGSQIDIEHGSVACLRPDVGGDPFPLGPVYWTVVYERALSGADHDIVMRQVQNTGALRGATYTAIDTSVQFEHSPAISKSDGRDGSSTTQRWCIAYRRDTGLGGPGESTTVRASTVSWDGVVDATQFVSPWYSNLDNRDLDVSNPTFESLGRKFLIVETRRDTVTPNYEIWGALVAAGAASGGWQELLDYSNNVDQPAVACDGARFAIVGSSLLGSDIIAALFDVVGSQLVRHDYVQVTSSPANDGVPAIVSHASGGATTLGDRQFGLAWNAGGATADTVLGARYRGMATNGGASTRTTGCGSLQVGYPGTVDFGALGTTIQVDVQNPAGIVGWAVGAPVSVSLPGCGTCVVGTTAVVLAVGASLQIPVPYDGSFVGLPFAFQAFSLGLGTCLGSLELSDTIDVTIR